MKHVGVREFRDRASQFITGGEPVAIERHGHVVGFFVPVGPDRDEARRALGRLESTVRRLVDQGDLTEEQLSALVDVQDAARSEEPHSA